MVAAFAITPTLIVLFGVIAFLIGGATLVASAIRMNYEAIARRIDLVRVPEAELMSAKKDAPRSPPQGLLTSEQREVVRRFSILGIPANYARAGFIGIRVFAAAGLGLLMIVAMRSVPALARLPFIMPFSAAIAAFLGWLLPSVLISASARRRGNEVADAMPEALDLLVVCVDAGLSLEDGLSRVVSELGRSRPALADELALTSADLRILPSRDQALARMADRVDLPSIRSVTTTLAQTLRYGTPLAHALRVIAAEMRSDALIKMEERASQLPALMTVPLMLLIMPTIFLIVGGPAVLRIIDIFVH